MPHDPAAWLATIARNECWARIRGRMREPLPTEEVERASTGSTALDVALRNADLAAMWAAIAALPLQQRDALLLRELGGLSYDDLAKALSVTGPAVESLLFRARAGVRAQLQAVYAGVTGGSWIEVLTRLAGGFGGGMAPVAAKVAVVGVGAAVATSGAVVAPRLLEHRVPPTAQVRRQAATTATTARASAAASALPVVVARADPATAAPARRHVPVQVEHRDRHSADDGAVSLRRHSADDSAPRAATERERRGGGEQQEDRSDSPTPSATQRSDDSGSGSGSDGGRSGGDGHGSDDGEGGGSVTTSTPAAVGAITAPEVPPIPEVSSSGGKG